MHTHIHSHACTHTCMHTHTQLWKITRSQKLMQAISLFKWGCTRAYLHSYVYMRIYLEGGGGSLNSLWFLQCVCVCVCVCACIHVSACMCVSGGRWNSLLLVQCACVKMSTAFFTAPALWTYILTWKCFIHLVNYRWFIHSVLVGWLVGLFQSTPGIPAQWRKRMGSDLWSFEEKRV